MWLKLASQHESYDAMRWGWAPDASQSWRQHFVDSLDKNETILLVAGKDGDRLIGFLMGSIGPTAPSMKIRLRGEVSDMFVEPEFRDQGIGHRLLQSAMEIMKTKGAGYVILYVAQANEAAHRFYESMEMNVIVNQMFKPL